MMKVLFLMFCLALGMAGQRAYAAVYTVTYLDSLGQSVAVDTLEGTTLTERDLRGERPNPVLQLIRKKQKLNKKITAAVLAFPFPFGIVGLHRIYMGTKPYVPVVYIATVGGVFGILPFIDFCVLLFDKDFDRYKDNGRVFMWVKD